MRRRLFTFASAVSAALFVAVCVLWVRGRTADRGWTIRRPTQVYYFHARGNAVICKALALSPPSQIVPADDGELHCTVNRGVQIILHHIEMAPEDVNRHLGFGYLRVCKDEDPDFFTELKPAVSFTFVTAPCWSLLLASGVVPGFWLRSESRRLFGQYRKRHGLCLQYGYDLRVTPARCPECGTSAKGAA